jgi:cellulose synthase/poly-beta-1,6-N-acetylglucosamine synthase-like glycosyltransferase
MESLGIAFPSGGKAAALNRAMELAEGEIPFFADVRQPVDPGCLARLVACFADPEIGVVTGELMILDGNTLLKWVSSIARTFTILMLASLCAATVLFVPPERLWKQAGIRSRKA